MKLLPAALLALAAASVQAQAGDANADLERIAAQRAAVEKRFEEEQKACRARFAVTDCIQQARRERNAALSDLRRQEIAVNEAERRRKAAEHQKELEERAAERGRKAAAAASSARQVRKEAEAPAPHGQARTPEGPKAPGPQGEARAPREPKASSGPTAEEAAKNRAEFDQRRQEAETHKAEVKARLAKRAKPPASALPVPQ